MVYFKPFKERGVLQSYSHRKRPQERREVSKAAELMSEAAGQVQGAGQEGREPPNTKRQTREVRGELGWGLQQHCPAGRAQR